ncbi:8119_t:CDS:2 [Entrophospora sp. SA101]|nr:8119_t:CDS:2 [Entrophospora sp. SA101]
MTTRSRSSSAINPSSSSSPSDSPITSTINAQNSNSDLNVNTSPFKIPTQMTKSSGPSLHQKYKDLLIFEERLKQNLRHLQKRSIKYEAFLGFMCLSLPILAFTSFIYKSNSPTFIFFSKLLLFIATVTLVMFFMKNLYEEKVRVASNEDLVTSEIIPPSSSAISSPIITNNDDFAPLTSKIKLLSSTSTTLKPIQLTFTKNIIPNSKITSNCSSNLTSISQFSFSSSSVVEETKKKTTGGQKRKVEGIEQRQHERSQISRDKKRKQMTDLEAQNMVLKEENIHLSKRLKTLEEEKSVLLAKLDTILEQFAKIRSQLSVSKMNKVLVDDVHGSAKSLQRHVKFRNLYRFIIANPFVIQPPATSTEQSDPIISTNTETSLVDLFDSFLDYDWGSGENSSSVHQ